MWPDDPVVVGEISEGPLLRAMRGLERRLYRSAAAITAVTESFVRLIEGRGGRGR